MKKLVLLLIAGLAAASVVIGFESAKAAELRHCNDSAIIHCGTLTASEFTKKYNENATKDLPAIFKHYGINPANISAAKAGTINQKGEIMVDGKIVATGAHVVGRDNYSNTRQVSIGNKTYYEKPASHAAALGAATEPAFVFMDKNGKYTGAIVKSCGNPVKATPVEPKPQPKPAAECKTLTAQITNRNKYTLTAQANLTNGATITGYQFVITNAQGTSVLNRIVTTNSTQRSIEGTLPAGSYTATVTVKTSVGDRTGTNCQAKFTVKPEATPPATVKNIEVCELATKKTVTIQEDEFNASKHSTDQADCKEVVVATPVEATPPATQPVQELPKTGLGQAITGVFGLGSVIAAAGYYIASRRAVLNS